MYWYQADIMVDKDWKLNTFAVYKYLNLKATC